MYLRKKALLTVLLLVAVFCACSVALRGAEASVPGDVSDLFRTWVWQGTEDGKPRTMSFTFGEDGLAEIEERWGGGADRMKASFKIEGAVIRLHALDDQLNPLELEAELSFRLENGVLRLTLDETEMVLHPLTPVQ